MESDHEHAKGYVYILTNPSFREDWVKIGKSSRPVNVRSKELDNTAVPLPFEIFATLETVKYHEVERLVHKTIDRLTKLRIRQSREFFNIEPGVALDVFRDIAQTIDDAVVTVYPHVGTPVESPDPPVEPPPPGRKPPFTFSMIGIKIGETVTFFPTNMDVKVVSDKKVEYKGQEYTLTEFTRKFMPEGKRNASDAYQGPKYFTYKGRILDDIRKELQK